MSTLPRWLFLSWVILSIFFFLSLLQWKVSLYFVALLLWQVSVWWLVCGSTYVWWAYPIVGYPRHRTCQKFILKHVVLRKIKVCQTIIRPLSWDLSQAFGVDVDWEKSSVWDKFQTTIGPNFNRNVIDVENVLVWRGRKNKGKYL